MANFCTNCGSPLDPHDSFCTSCGAEVLVSPLASGSTPSWDTSQQSQPSLSDAPPAGEPWRALLIPGEEAVFALDNICTNCGSPLDPHDSFCTSCGAEVLVSPPASGTTPSRDTSQSQPSLSNTPSAGEPWRALLIPGEEGIFSLDNITLQVPEWKSGLLARRRWKLFKIDSVVLTGLRLLCVKKGHLFTVDSYPFSPNMAESGGAGFRSTPMPSRFWNAKRSIRTSFTVDPAVVRVMVEEDLRRDKERLDSVRNTSVSESLRHFYAATILGVWDETKRQQWLTSDKSDFPPLVWVWPKTHRVRPLRSYWKLRWLFWTGLSLSLVATPFLCGLPLLAFLLLCLFVQLGSLPFRMKPWTGIFLSPILSLKRPFEGQAIELALFDELRAKELLELLEPPSTEIRALMQNSGRLGDRLGFGKLLKELRDIRTK